jgi:hypothetical protein
MYLPMAELQNYRGQLTCQYCIMDLRDAERKHEERKSQPLPESGKKIGGRSEEEHLSYLSDDERCDRCKRKMGIVYIFNNRKLCEICVHVEKEEWEEKGSGAMPMVLKFRIKGNEGLLSKIMAKLEIAWGDLRREKRAKTATKAENSRVKPVPIQEGPKKEEKKDDSEGKKKKDKSLEFEKHFADE